MMKPEIDALQLNAFVDGELSLDEQVEMEQRLQTDADLRARTEQPRDLRQAIGGQALYHAAPAALRSRVLGLMAAPEPAAGGAVALLRRWLAWRPLAASLAVVALASVALNLALWRSATDERTLQDVLASHVRSGLTQHWVDVASSDHHTVKPWLSTRLDFSPPVPDVVLPETTFLGARLDYLDDRPVAALVYRQGQHLVSSFVWPGAGPDRPLQRSVQRGYQVAHWRADGMNHWVISDASGAEFARLLAALDTASGQH